VTTLWQPPYNITDDPCDDVDDLDQITVKYVERTVGPAIPIGDSSWLTNEVSQEGHRTASGDGMPYYTANIDLGYLLSLLIPWLRPSDNKVNKVITTMTKNPNNVAWLLLTTPGNPSNGQNTTLTTTSDYLGQSMWQRVHIPQNCLADIGWVHLATFIAKVESCLPCRVRF